MLPTASVGGRSRSQHRAQPYLPQYLRRIVKWRQMDVEYTFWQMLHLCFSPRIVYQHTKYHKREQLAGPAKAQTKNQWSRDDPAFVVICCGLLAGAATAFSVAYGKDILSSLTTIVFVVAFDFLFIGVVLASICWFIANQYLREEAAGHTHVVEQKVEWLYAFDVHCNSFFPVFVLLYVIQYFLSPLLLERGFLPLLLSNILYGLAFSYYHYLNFLGYDVLPFLERTTLFLYPIGLLLIALPFSVVGRFNPTRFIMGFYFD
eukprot:SM000151S01484  [mRNA]  locus=s151:181431:183865:+ [translate_table: standard]